MNTADELCDRVSFIVDGELRITDQPEKLKINYGSNTVLVELQNGGQEEFQLEGLSKNGRFFDFLSKSDIKRINTQEATLEEVFIEVTGKSLVV